MEENHAALRDHGAAEPLPISLRQTTRGPVPHAPRAGLNKRRRVAGPEKLRPVGGRERGDERGQEQPGEPRQASGRITHDVL